jgi:hypothetical protein
MALPTVEKLHHLRSLGCIYSKEFIAQLFDTYEVLKF